MSSVVCYGIHFSKDTINTGTNEQEHIIVIYSNSVQLKYTTHIQSANVQTFTE